MTKNIIKILEERGLIQDIIPGTEEQLMKEMTHAYVGFDPTADSLHIGSMLPIILLMWMQKCGHKPYALVGGATGMIGDPTGKSAERNLLNEETLQANLKGIENQLKKFLDMSESCPNKAEIVNNYDWFKGWSFLDFIRDVGKNITVNYMMAKDSVQKRLEFGLSFTEFTYQLIQGYDFYYLHKNNNIKVQFGGADQWGNITTGTELIRKMGGGDVYAFTCPLLKKADGGKFGKTEGGNVWLDASKTSPYKFYQFWLNVSDEDAQNYIKIFTFLEMDEINQLISQHQEAPHLRILQKRLAEEITVLVHSREDYEQAVSATQILFGQADYNSLSSLSSEQIVEIFEGVPQFQVQEGDLNEGIDIIDFLVNGQVLPSKSEARKMLQSGGISINKNKWNIEDKCIDINHKLQNGYILVQKGKKNYFLCKII